jgi:hypothetical protein
VALLHECLRTATTDVGQARCYLAFQALQISCPSETFASRKAITLGGNCVRPELATGAGVAPAFAPSKGAVLRLDDPAFKWWPARVTRPVPRIKSPLHHFNACRPNEILIFDCRFLIEEIRHRGARRFDGSFQIENCKSKIENQRSLQSVMLRWDCRSATHVKCRLLHTLLKRFPTSLTCCKAVMV